MKDVFNKSISYQLIDFSDEKEENEKKIEKSNKESTEMDDNVEWKDSIKGDPVVVATNGTYCVIRRGHKIHAYGIIKIGDPISSIKRWRDKRVLHSMLTKGNYVLLPKPEPYNYDTDNKDLQKSHILHKERLVQKRVPVHHANGSITYRMQWVKVSKEPNKPVVSTMHQERPSNPTKNPIPQEGHTETPTEESEHTPDADITSPLSDIPALRGYYKEIDDTFNGEEYKDEDSVTGRLNMILSISQKHWSTIKDILLKDCNNDNSVSPFLKDVRKGILKMTRPSSFRTLGSHPSILHHALINLLGEDVYKNARSQLVSANLTINTTEEHIPDILKNGYKGKTIMDYIKYHSSEDELEENIRDYHRLIQESEDEDDLENNMFELDGIWATIGERYVAEKKALGLDFIDAKPAYIAYNPDGSTVGGAPEYGDGSVLEIHPSQLKWCTLTKTDSFFSDNSIARAYSMEHLSDLYILRSIQSMHTTMNPGTYDEELEYFDPENNELDYPWTEFFKYDAEIPLELQYHQSSVPSKYITPYFIPGDENYEKSMGLPIRDTYNVSDNLDKIEKSDKQSIEMDDKIEWKDSVKGDPVVVATNGEYAVIRRGSYNYGLLKIGGAVSDIRDWKTKQLLLQMMSKGDYTLLSEPESYNFDYIEEINKSHILHKEKLIKKRVAVKHANGKVTFRMQWVKASEDPKANKEGAKQPMPEVKPTHEPTEQATKNTPQEQEQEPDNPKEDSGFSLQSFLKLAGKLNKKSANKESVFPDPVSSMKEYDIPEEFSSLYKDLAKPISTIDENGLIGYKTKLKNLTRVAEKHWKKTIQPAILKDIESTSIDPRIKAVQKRTLDICLRTHNEFCILGSHPKMLRNILDNVVGKDLCDRLRADLMGCNLTINTHSDHIDNILKEGYKASTLESYAKSTLSGELYDKVSDVIWGTGRAYFEEGMKELTKISEDCDYEDSNHVEAIMARAQAEYDAFGLSFEDPKPSYLAFNPIGSLDGACPEYGDGAVMQVSPEILNQCTGNDDDTFATSRPVAKVYDMEHLKDLFILKHALYDYGFQDEYESIFLDKNSPTGLRDEWSSDKMGTIPIELQFHNETVPPEYLSKYHVKSK